MQFAELPTAKLAGREHNRTVYNEAKLGDYHLLRGTMSYLQFVSLRDYHCNMQRQSTTAFKVVPQILHCYVTL